jgi:hypothetical protein
MTSIINDEIVVTREKKRLKQEKQRQTNLLRAQKMHEARMELSLHNVVSKKASNKFKKFNIGCSGWFYWHWRKIFYPEHLPTNQWFDHYSKHFKTVELNAPFYSWPTLQTVDSWLRQAKKKKYYLYCKGM